jgi:hypothetical protein
LATKPLRAIRTIIDSVPTLIAEYRVRTSTDCAPTAGAGVFMYSKDLLP